MIPFLREAAVEDHHWLTSRQFNDGLAIGGVLPAPLIIFSTFVGYIAGGLAGALVMTLGIFLPAFVFPIFLHRQLVAVSENERLHPFLLGVAAAVIGLIAAVTVTILETSITDVYGALIALGAFAALQRWHSKLTVVYVMAAPGRRRDPPAHRRLRRHIPTPRLASSQQLVRGALVTEVVDGDVLDQLVPAIGESFAPVFLPVRHGSLGSGEICARGGGSSRDSHDGERRLRLAPAPLTPGQRQLRR